MAYTDQRIGGNQRTAVVTVVALLQGAVFIALVNGLAVQFINRPPPPRTEGAQIPLTPLPEPPKPKPELLRDPVPLPVAPQPVPRDPVFASVATLPQLQPQPQPTEIALPPTPAPLPKAPLLGRAAEPTGNPGNWATSNDYPTRDLREGHQGTTRFKLTIGTDGRVRSCSIAQSSGFAGLDDAACRNITRRARFRPAVDGNGQPVSGDYVNSIRWVIPE